MNYDFWIAFALIGGILIGIVIGKFSEREASRKHADEQSIEFADWIDLNHYAKHLSGKWYNTTSFGKMFTPLSDNELLAKWKEEQK